jgi:hypothetical protein
VCEVGIRVEGLGFRVQGLRSIGYRGSRFRVLDLWFMI